MAESDDERQVRIDRRVFLNRLQVIRGHAQLAQTELTDGHIGILFLDWIDSLVQGVYEAYEKGQEVDFSCWQTCPIRDQFEAFTSITPPRPLRPPDAYPGS